VKPLDLAIIGGAAFLGWKLLQIVIERRGPAEVDPARFTGAGAQLAGPQFATGGPQSGGDAPAGPVASPLTYGANEPVSTGVWGAVGDVNETLEPSMGSYFVAPSSSSGPVSGGQASPGLVSSLHQVSLTNYLTS
jgi:hypothetical protein